MMFQRDIQMRMRSCAQMHLYYDELLMILRILVSQPTRGYSQQTRILTTDFSNHRIYPCNVSYIYNTSLCVIIFKKIVNNSSLQNNQSDRQYCMNFQ